MKAEWRIFMYMYMLYVYVYVYVYVCACAYSYAYVYIRKQTKPLVFQIMACLSPVLLHEGIVWANDDSLSFGNLGTNFNEISIIEETDPVLTNSSGT